MKVRRGKIIRHGLELGINFYDTAIVYQNGTSEQFVGKALRDFAKRDEYVIATKFTPRTQEEIDWYFQLFCVAACQGE